MQSIGEPTNNADLVIPGFQQLVQWLKGRMAGHWFVGGCTKPEAIGDKVKALAVAFAKRIIDGDARTS